MTSKIVEVLKQNAKLELRVIKHKSQTDLAPKSNCDIAIDTKVIQSLNLIIEYVYMHIQYFG